MIGAAAGRKWRWLLAFGPGGRGLGETAWVWIAIFGVAFAIGLLLWGCLKIRDWYRDDAGHADDPAMFLTSLRESTRRGDVSDDEYRSIQRRLQGSLSGYAAGSDPPMSPQTSPRGDVGDQPPEAEDGASTNDGSAATPAKGPATD